MVHISTGDVFRKNIKTETELGLKAKVYAEKGELVPDEITVSMLENEIELNLPSNGFIFDGFPRTIYQANEMNKILSKHKLLLTATVALDVSDNLLKDRLLKRGKISGRADDQSEDKILTRLNEYRKKTEPLIPGGYWDILWRLQYRDRKNIPPNRQGSTYDLENKGKHDKTVVSVFGGFYFYYCFLTF